MSASIWNQGAHHAFVVGDTGKPGDGLHGSLIEFWGNPPTNWGVIAGTEGKFKPGTNLAICRIVYDPQNMFYPAYYVSGLRDNGYSVVTAIWTGKTWDVRDAG